MTIEQPRGHGGHRFSVWYCCWCGGKFAQKQTEIRNGKASRFCSASCHMLEKYSKVPKKPGYERRRDQKNKWRWKDLVRDETERLVKKGIIKKKPCRVCGSDKSHAHHSDYSNPYKVDWLCQSHHMKLHRGTLVA